MTANSSKSLRRYKAYKAHRNGVKTKARVAFNVVDKTAAENATLSIETKGKVAFNTMDFENASSVTLVPDAQEPQDMSRSR